MLNPRSLTLPIAKPLLPDLAMISPYIRQIDESRGYSNRGPLVRCLEDRLSAHFGFESQAVMTAASGTMALIGAIMGAAGIARPDRPLCFCPAMTFVASAAAAQVCGYAPHFVDVAPESWCLDPVRLRRHPELSKVGLVLVVAPYGRLPQFSAWQSFMDETGIPVVIDGAACFDMIGDMAPSLPERIPIALSFHATKAFGCGEGGAILARDRVVLEACFRSLNHGFLGDRIALTLGVNGKMSEYHAAVALAELDGWAGKFDRLRGVARRYRAEHARCDFKAELFVHGDISSTYALLTFPTQDETLSAMHRLRSSGIEARYWYGQGVHRQPAFAARSTDQLDVTEDLIGRLLGLPFFVDMSDGEIGRVYACLTQEVPMQDPPIRDARNEAWALTETVAS